MPTLSPTSIAAIRSSVVPATVAMQVVSREYVDGAVANTVRKTGDETVAGVKTFDSSPLVPTPSAPTAAANKDYVDVSVAAGSGSSTLGINRGGTGQTSWTPARCVRVANNGSSLESAPADCGIASNADMVDGQHASAFQAAMANAATLSKIAESGGNPLWNGSAWPGGGGSGNATQIQGKNVDTPTAAGQQLTYDGTKFAKQAKANIEVRDLAGMDCTGATDMSSVLNTLTGTADSISNRTVSFKGCSHVRLDNQWLIKYQFAPTIDLSETQLLGCNGAAGPMVLLERTGNWTVTSSSRGSAVIYTNAGSWCGGAGSNFTGGIGTDNNFASYPGGYTNTAGTLTNVMMVGNATTTGYTGFSTTTAENQENFNISAITVYCNASQGSIGIYMQSAFAQNAKISHNSVVGCMWGIWWRAPNMFVEYNNLTANGDWDIFTPTTAYGGSTSGAGLFCQNSKGNIIRGNILAEGSGAFLWARNDSAGSTCSGTLEDNGIAGDWVNVNCNGTGCGLHDGHHVPVGQHAVDSGGVLFLKGNSGDNRTSSGVLNTVPLIGDSRYPGGGSLATYIDLGNKWTQPTAVFDSKPPQNGFRHLSSSSGDQDVTTFDEIMQSAAGGSSSHNPPLKIWRTGTAGGGSYVDYAMTTLDDLYQQATNGNSFVIDVIRNDPGTPTGLAVRPSFFGGVNVVASPAIATPSVTAQGGSSGSTWGYKVVGVSSGGTRYTTAEATVSNAATLDSSHWSRVDTRKMPGYVEYQLWLTTQPGGAGRTLGMIAKFNTTTANASCAIDAVQGCDGGNQRWYMTDKGQATLTAGSPAATNADGRMVAAGPVVGTQLQPTAATGTPPAVTASTTVIPNWNSDLVDGKHASDFLAATTQLPLTRTAVSHKWLASYDATTGSYTQTQPDYSDLTGTPTLATVAATGAYADLTGKPTLAVNTTATSHQFFSAYNSTTGAFTKAQPDYSDLTGAPTLAATKTCAGTDKVSAYDASTGVFTCSADQTGTGGSGITSLNGATVTTQSFVDGANIHVSTNTGTGAHTIAVTGLGDAAAKNTGTAAGTVAAGDDSRFTNARAPTTHASTHQNGGSDEIATATAGANAIPKAGSGGTLAVGWIPDLSATYLALHSTADLAAGLSAQYTDWSASSGGASIKNKPTLGGAAALNVGTTTGTVAAGDDSRFTNARTPTTHASTHQNGGSDEIATATAGANAIPKAGSGGQLAAGWMPALTGDVTTSAGAVATALRTGLNVKRCELHVWGTGTSSVLQDTDDEVASCLNKYGVTWTVTYVGCWANAGSPTVMITKTGGNNVLTGNLTCGTASWASGSLTGTTADKQTADGGTVDVNIVAAGGTATNIRVVIAGTI